MGQVRRVKRKFLCWLLGHYPKSIQQWHFASSGYFANYSSRAFSKCRRCGRQLIARMELVGMPPRSGEASTLRQWAWYEEGPLDDILGWKTTAPVRPRRRECIVNPVRGMSVEEGLRSVGVNPPRCPK